MGEEGRPLRLRKGTRTSEAMFAGDARGRDEERQANKHPPNPLTQAKGGLLPASHVIPIGAEESLVSGLRFFTSLRSVQNDMGSVGAGFKPAPTYDASPSSPSSPPSM